MRAQPPKPRLTLLALAALLASSCGPPPASLSLSVRAALEARVGPEGSGGPVYCRKDRICGSEALPSFYRARDYKPAWIDDDLGQADAAAFLEALRGVSGDGLDPENYHLSTLESLFAEIRAARLKGLRNVRPEALADLEMLLTDAFLLCGSHLAHGQVNPETIQSEWFIKGRVEDLAAALEKGLAANDLPGALDSLRPGHAVYRGLMKALREYEAIVAAGGWPRLPAGPKLVKGDRDARIEDLRRTLTATGEMRGGIEAAGEPDFFDDALEGAVKRFQRRHGLEPDGVLGAGTATALSVSAADRLNQIRANLERWRWITPELGERYILVNVADFRLSAVEKGLETLSMPVIVGSAYRRTPDFSGRMTYLEFNPTWTVPPKLVREDILPKARKDPSYLRKKGFHVFANWSAGAGEIDLDAVDWMLVNGEALPYKFRQDPGPQNSLGRIKFMFPNKHDVYLHDTPERWLFTLAARDQSSGCIRIERPVDLAEYVLRGEPDWDRDRILEAIESGETRVVILRSPLDVHLLYWTAWLGSDGKVQFRDDIYLRDAALNRALEEKASAPPK
jgi:murein L,D-transpeptidase YcbB/YkuD